MKIFERLKALEARIYAADTHEGGEYNVQFQEALAEAWPQLLVKLETAENLANLVLSGASINARGERDLFAAAQAFRKAGETE